MNIAVFSHYFSPEIGAPSARIFEMAQQWIKAGHHVEVVTCFPNHPTGKLYPGYEGGCYLSEVQGGIQVHRHWTYITPNKGFLKKTVGHASFLPSAMLNSIPRLAKTDVSIGTSPTFFAAMAAARASARFGIPFVMEVRDLWPAAMVELGVLKQPLLVRFLERWELALYRRADRIVTVTEAFRTNLVARGVSAAKVTSITNGADEEYWQPIPGPEDLRTRLGVQSKFVILYIGAHGISQALQRILESARKLADRQEIHFLFVGEGAEKKELVQYSREAQLVNVQFLDPVDKAMVKSLYALADVCLVPLRDIPLFDTFIPSKMFEMMAMKKPILASLRGEAANILNAAGCALVVEPENSSAIADAILTLYNQPPRRALMGERGRQFVIDHYSRRSLAQRYVGVLQDAIFHHDACRTQQGEGRASRKTAPAGRSVAMPFKKP